MPIAHLSYSSSTSLLSCTLVQQVVSLVTYHSLFSFLTQRSTAIQIISPSSNAHTIISTSHIRIGRFSSLRVLRSPVSAAIALPPDSHPSPFFPQPHRQT